jgi:hypothetical protein
MTYLLSKYSTIALPSLRVQAKFHKENCLTIEKSGACIIITSSRRQRWEGHKNTKEKRSMLPTDAAINTEEREGGIHEL